MIISRKAFFCCGHRYESKNLSEKENDKTFGKCFRSKGHGHNYMVEVQVKGTVDPKTSLVVNLNEIKDALSLIIENLDHKFLNYEIPYFSTTNPTTENIANYIWDQFELKFKSNEVKIHSLRLQENEELSVTISA